MGEKVDEETAAREFFRKEKENLVDKVAKLSEDEFVKRYKRHVPEVRQDDNVGEPIRELIGWGLLTPIEEDGQTIALSVHSLVRDFCRDKQEPQIWRDHLRDAALYYTNQTKLLRQDDKSPAAVWIEMEAFEILFEAQDFEDAASILIRADPLLDRWGFGRYLESLYERIIDKVQRKTQSILIHNLGILLQERGDYPKALEFYEKSLKITEELGDPASLAATLGQMGKLFTETKKYPQAFEKLLSSLSIFSDLQSPYAKMALSDLKNLREHWGAENFDKAWREKTGQSVPDWLKEAPRKPKEHKKK